MDRVPMTVAGEKALRVELKHLKSVKRPAIVQAIEVARAHGDLSENAEYHAAKEDQSFNEGRIVAIESQLAAAQVIDPVSLSGDKVVFGATVSLLDIEKDQAVKYQIVGVDEADLDQGTISFSSPIARALIGKVIGDEVVVQAPGGDREYEIEDVQYI